MVSEVEPLFHCYAKRMITLFLNTAGNPNLLALCTNERTLAVEHIDAHSDAEIVPKIEKVLSDNNLEYSDLTRLACAIGPGGFTSLRIGITAINTLAYSLDLPSSGIHLSELWAARRQWQEARGKRQDGNNSSFLWLHSTRRSQLFVKGFGEDAAEAPIALMEIDDVLRLQGEYVGELIEEHKKILSNCVPMPEAKLLTLEEVLPQLLSGLKYQKQNLNPWYGRAA